MSNLCEIMTRYGSDKGSGHHNYTVIYDNLFSEVRENKINLLEIGIGSTNPNIPSNMGLEGKPGASLYGWREYFNNGLIYGADIDHTTLFTSERIKTIYCDQTSEISMKLMLKELNTSFDIIIDDGYQNFNANYNSLINCLPYLNKDNGIYIIEDVKQTEISYYSDELLNNLKDRFKLSFIKLIDIPHPTNVYDNRILLISTKVGFNFLSV